MLKDLLKRISKLSANNINLIVTVSLLGIVIIRTLLTEL